jgi:hypothetical protein
MTSAADLRTRIERESAGAQQLVRHVAAGIAPAPIPKGAIVSPFGNPKRQNIGAPFDPAAVPVTDRKPGQYRPTQPVGGYRALYERMLPGQCAELPRDKAAAFARWARGKGIALRREAIGPGLVGVWRPAEGESADPPVCQPA